jgi:predicted AlkP superfamily phosphohydrolase/phosphomutase
VLRYFRRLDADIGRLIEEAGPDTRVMIMSDHGMGRASRFIVLNNLLLELGFIRLASDATTRLKALAFRGGFTLRNVHRLVDGIGLAKHAEYKNVYSFDALLKRFFLSFHNVDWSRTRAYSFGRHYGSVFLNVRGREPEGSVAPGAEYERTRDELADAVLAWRDPKLRRPLVSQCLRREQVYSGARFEEAPDLILLPENPDDIFYGLSDFGSNRIWDQTYRYSGMHRDEGMLIACGPGIRAGQDTASAEIVDLAPTLLYWLGCEIPGDMDGRPLAALMDPDLVAAAPPRLSARTSDGRAAGPREYTQKEEEEIMDRLRDLGYMS